MVLCISCVIIILANKVVTMNERIYPDRTGTRKVHENIHSIKINTEIFPVTKTDWFGYAKYDFSVAEIEYCIVAPKKRALHSPWIWRAEFFGHEPQADLSLLDKGWYVVYVPSAASLYGSPEAVRRWDVAYEYLTREYGLFPKPVLEGFSRGGLLVYNWAAANPGKVTCIYADAPVCAIQSWPGGKGKGLGSPEDWQLCLKAYGLTEEGATDYRHNPIDNLKPLVCVNIPLLHVCGDIDEVVPMAENTDILQQRYKKLGGHIEVITKANCDHHPHSLPDPKPIVDFILKSFKGV